MFTFSITASICGGLGFGVQRLHFESGSELLSITDVELKAFVLPFTVSIFIESTTPRVWLLFNTAKHLDSH